ncbi:MAG: radical SAM protein, partial [Candidatus Odinarchaeia archaeon]
LDKKLAKIIEPTAPAPDERLETMRKCVEEGFLAGISYIPVLPYLSDTEEQLNLMVKTAKEYNAKFILVGGLTLFGNGPNDCKTRYYQFLEDNYPELIQEYRKLYRVFPTPTKEYQKRLAEKTQELCHKHRVQNGIININTKT